MGSDDTINPAMRVWVEAQGSGRLIGRRRMVGGITSLVEEVSLRGRDGTTHHLVLRRWPGDPNSADRVQREAKALARLEPFPEIKAPRLVGFDDGGQAGAPALLMTRLRGESCLDSEGLGPRIAQMSQVAAAIHSLGIHAPASTKTAPLDLPEQATWDCDNALWSDARELLQGPPPTQGQPTFIHGDFQLFNLLWSGDELSGVIDWTAPAVGPPELDIAHCRLNLAVLFGPEPAAALMSAYESVSGRKLEPWWDVYRIVRAYNSAWADFIPTQVAGRVRVDPGMDDRVESLLREALDRVAGRSISP